MKNLYALCYWCMVAGYFSTSLQVPGIKMKIVGVLLTLVNAMLFWR